MAYPMNSDKWVLRDWHSDSTIAKVGGSVDGMSDPYNSDLARQAFAVERSHRDAASSNETARATAQAVILINGGAATAVLAFLAKGGLPQALFQAAAICLGLYALGVVAGACMMYCTVRSLDYYGLRWRLEAHPEKGSDARRNRELGEAWWKRMRQCFYAAIAAFIISSMALAGVLFVTQVPTKPAAASQAPSAQ